MLHPRKDYQRIQDPAGLIPEDEPVFLLRAQDKAAVYTVRHWARVNKELGGDPVLSEKAYAWANKMDQWPVKKLADLPAEPEQQEYIDINTIQDQTDEESGDSGNVDTEPLSQVNIVIINKHIQRLPKYLTTRRQVIDTVNLFSDWIKVELSNAFRCPVTHVAKAMADYLGFTVKREAEKAVEEKNQQN